jgi:uncharacterized protein (TIGR02646 family)
MGVTNNLRKRPIYAQLLKIYEHRCAYCKRYLQRTEITLDHFIPKSKGGPSTYTNLIPACKECNSKKDNIEPIQWMRRHNINLIDIISNINKVFTLFLLQYSHSGNIKIDFSTKNGFWYHQNLQWKWLSFVYNNLTSEEIVALDNRNQGVLISK